LLAQITVTANTEAADFFEMFLAIYHITGHYIQGDSKDRYVNNKHGDMETNQNTVLHESIVYTSCLLNVLMRATLNIEGVLTKLHGASHPLYSKAIHANGRFVERLTCKTDEINYSRF
jgi:hypothetical protein